MFVIKNDILDDWLLRIIPSQLRYQNEGLLQSLIIMQPINGIKNIPNNIMHVYATR